MKFRKMILVLSITFIIIFACMLGSSYAYYSFAETDISATTDELKAGNVIFSGSDYINMKTGVPISDDDMETYASKTSFMVVPPVTAMNSYDFAFNVSLYNINLDTELRIEDFRYKLVCEFEDGSSLNVSSGDDLDDYTEGDGTTFDSDDFLLATYSSEENEKLLTQNTNCNLYVWLHDSGENQNDLMDKKFSALVKVTTAVRAK